MVSLLNLIRIAALRPENVYAFILLLLHVLSSSDVTAMIMSRLVFEFTEMQGPCAQCKKTFKLH